MLNDARWRKMPVDILTNESMAYVESQLPEEYHYAPYMFYQAALRKADEDGIFDLEDGVIFARLMRVPSVKMVFIIANLMGQRKLIFRVSKESNKCLIADWEYPKGSDKPTWAERREAVLRQIQEEKAAKSCISEKFETEEAPESISFDIECDKNLENVTQMTECDKNLENVSEKNETEREKEREKERKETHTQEREKESLRGREREASAVAEQPESSAPACAEKKALAQKNKRKAESKKEVEPVTLPEETAKKTAIKTVGISENGEKESGDFAEVTALLDSFFLNNGFGYDVKKGRSLVDSIAKQIIQLSSEELKAAYIAQVLCDEFKKMHESDGQWKDIPLIPKYMSNHAVWEHLLTIAGKKLLKSKKNNQFLQKAQEEQKLAEAERDAVIAELDAEYIKFGIDPQDPNKVSKLMFARKAAEKEKLQAMEALY